MSNNSHSQNRDQDVLVRVKNLRKYFPIRRGVFKRVVGHVQAVDDVSLEIHRGETLGLVGESGCGKTTLGRTILHLYKPTSGHIEIAGHNLTKLPAGQLRRMRREMQIIFQDPFSALNPRMTIGSIIEEPLKIHTKMSIRERHERVKALLELVGLDAEMGRRFPHEFSGGQRQRIVVARALALNPSFIVADEPITSLDVSIQAQVVNLLEDLQNELNLTYLFITHDLSMVRHLCDRVAVMYLGKIVEMTSVDQLYTTPEHPYTKALLSAIPVPDPTVEGSRQRIILQGDVPNPADPPKGCNFNTRCPLARERCFQEEPALLELRPNHLIACYEAEERLATVSARQEVMLSAEAEN